MRNGTATRARLMELLTVASSSNPRWLIRFEESPSGQNSKDEEVYEHTFVGKVTTTDQAQEGANTTDTKAKESVDCVGKNSPSASDTGSISSRGTGRSSQRSKHSPPASYQQEQQLLPAAAEESSSVREDGDGAPSPSASDTSAARLLSAREARVRRRQGAVFAHDKPILDSKISMSSSLHNTTTNSNNTNNKRKLTGAAKLAAAKKKREKEEDCVKIKFLTGTLYLYRGERRRAEFVRRV